MILDKILTEVHKNEQTKEKVNTSKKMWKQMMRKGKQRLTPILETRRKKTQADQSTNQPTQAHMQNPPNILKLLKHEIHNLSLIIK